MVVHCIMFRRLVLITVFVFLLCASGSAQNWMPDENLRAAVRESIENDGELTKQMMASIEDLNAFGRNIRDITGLEYAVNLKNVSLYNNDIKNIEPLSNLENLESIWLAGCFVSDISSLSKLTELQALDISYNLVSDISPLIPLKNLVALFITGNPIVDYSPLNQMPQIVDLRRHAVCEPKPNNIDNIQNRSFPSVFSAWDNIINLPHLSEMERYAYHDLMFSFTYDFINTSDGIQLISNKQRADSNFQLLRSKNPNLIILRPIEYYLSGTEIYPPDWKYWLRDENGEIYRDRGIQGLIDFTYKEWQDIVVEQAIVTYNCGFYDGIFFDHWGFAPRLRGHRTVEEETIARDMILKRIRAAVGDDFLILVNSGVPDVLRWKDYVNGVFFETHGSIQGEIADVNLGHVREHFIQIESEISIAESSLAEPVINCVEGYGLSLLAPDHPENLRWMRVFTTMTLTHTNGYVLYNIGAASPKHKHGWDNEFLKQTTGHLLGGTHIHDHEHYWYNFWDADLGYPISEKGQLYKNRDGVFIREFAHGWAVYNRSRQEQTIILPDCTGVTSQISGTKHTIPDLDGEIYLKTHVVTPDINGDGIVNILDLVIVANAFGTEELDLNGDGVVNILDLVIVANAF